MNIAVNLDQVAAAGVAVEAIDVLSQHTDLEALLPFGDDGVGIVEVVRCGRNAQSGADISR